MKHQIAIRLDGALLDVIDDNARAQNRNRTNMIDTLLREALMARELKTSGRQDHESPDAG